MSLNGSSINASGCLTCASYRQRVKCPLLTIPQRQKDPRIVAGDHVYAKRSEAPRFLRIVGVRCHDVQAGLVTGIDQRLLDWPKTRVGVSRAKVQASVDHRLSP